MRNDPVNVAVTHYSLHTAPEMCADSVKITLDVGTESRLAASMWFIVQFQMAAGLRDATSLDTRECQDVARWRETH